MGAFSKLKNILLTREKFLLIGHENPDGDSLGALLATKELLDILGKQSKMVCRDSVPSVFSFLSGTESIDHDFLMGNFDAIILLDNGDLKRTGFADRIIKAKDKNIPIINIDHHIKNDIWKIATVNFANEKASSTCEIIFEIIKGLDIDINSKMATSLLAGIFNDTGGFRHSNTDTKVFMMVAELLKKGARLKLISDGISNSKSVSMLKLWGVALERLKFHEKYQLLSSIILRKDIENLDASEDEVSGLVNLINTMPEAKIALLLHETKTGRIRGSLRTESDEVDVSKIANIFGGGGHKKASGFSLAGQLYQDGESWKII